MPKYNNIYPPPQREVTGEEPVTVAEFKNYARLEGFIDTDASTADSLSDFDFDDDLIADMITTAREILEKQSGLILIPSTVTVFFTNLIGGVELPGPMDDFDTLTNCHGSALSSWTLFGGDFKIVKSPKEADLTAVYDAGYGNTELPALPEGIKLDILRLVFFLYVNRGDVPGAVNYASSLCKSYSRNTWLK